MKIAVTKILKSVKYVLAFVRPSTNFYHRGKSRGSVRDRIHLSNVIVITLLLWIEYGGGFVGIERDPSRGQ